MGNGEQSEGLPEPSCVLGRVEEQGEVSPGKHAHKPTCSHAGGSLPMHSAWREAAELLELVHTPAGGEEQSLSGGPRWHLPRATPHTRALSGSLPTDRLPAMGRLGADRG